jgi:spoIIIJ-associated protein
MEWVETTGRTVEEAKKAALEQLGVAEADADLQVVSEPKLGLFGRLREEARVRARVQPRYPRSKGERRDRRRRPVTDADQSSQSTSSSRPSGSGTSGGSGGSGGNGGTNSGPSGSDGNNSQPAGAASAGRRRRRAPSSGPGATPEQEGANFSDVGTASIEEQVRLAEEFLQGLLNELGSTATVTSHELTDGVVELVIDGENLGTLIGPRGATLLALQELTRTVLQHRVGSSECRVVVDVNGYRKRRQDALARFAQQVAAEVRESNTRRALEPMPPADRKVVHDAVNEIPGVSTTSEGEEPYRRVVLIPEPLDNGDEPGAATASEQQSESVSS